MIASTCGHRRGLIRPNTNYRNEVCIYIYKRTFQRAVTPIIQSHASKQTSCLAETLAAACTGWLGNPACTGSSGMSAAAFKGHSQTITPASDPKQCVGGQQQKILYVSLRQPPNTRRRDKSQEYCLQDICLCLLYTSYLNILCRSHVSDSCRSVHQ